MNREDIFNIIAKVCLDITGYWDSIYGEDSTFYGDICVDSIDTIQITIDLEHQFDISIPESAMNESTTVGELIDYILENIY